MSSQDFSSEFYLSDSGSRLLSESLLSAGSSRTGHGGDDLSLSELTLHDRPLQPPRRKFSLFAQPPSPQRGDGSALADEDEDGEGGHDQTMRPEEVEKAQRVAAKTREEKLQSDLYVLKKLNAAFDVYKDALKETQSSTDRVAAQLAHTNALLDKYVNILSRSEQVTKLLLDERWEGAEADEAQLEREMREEAERIKKEEEERILAEQLEQKRLEHEAQERRAREQRERLDREKQEHARSISRGSGVRGVRGTRASMRGTRGNTMGARGTSTTSRSTPSSDSSAIAGRRTGPSTASSRTTSRSSTVKK